MALYTLRYSLHSHGPASIYQENSPSRFHCDQGTEAGRPGKRQDLIPNGSVRTRKNQVSQKAAAGWETLLFYRPVPVFPGPVLLHRPTSQIPAAYIAPVLPM